jgi:hypothetical protein
LLVVAACHHGGAPPPVPSCADAAEHVRSLLAPWPRAVRTHDAFVRRCTADGWSVAVRECVVATRSLRRPRHCKAKLTPQQRTALNYELRIIDAAPWATELDACHDYQVLVERLPSCRGMSRAARSAHEQAYRELSRRWEAKDHDTAALAAQCRSMLEGLRQATGPVCEW